MLCGLFDRYHVQHMCSVVCLFHFKAPITTHSIPTNRAQDACVTAPEVRSEVGPEVGPEVGSEVMGHVFAGGRGSVISGMGTLYFGPLKSCEIKHTIKTKNQ